MKHLLSRIEKMMPGFSKGQRRIAQYIEDHYDKAAFMTASKLGATVGVSESTVVRFATEVGYDGYPQLQKAMQEMIRNKLTSVQRIEVTSNRIGDADVLDSVLNQDIDKIRRTLEETSHEGFLRGGGRYRFGQKDLYFSSPERFRSGNFPELLLQPDFR